MLKTITFSDLEKNNYWSRHKEKAIEDLVDFFNSHKEYKIIKIIERQELIDNGGNGTKYYSLDVIYKDRSHKKDEK